MIEDFVAQIDLSLWFALVGLVLLVGEAFIPGGTLMVVGVGLLAAGVTGLIFEINTLLPLTVLTAVYGAVAFAGFRHFEFFGERGEQTSASDSLRGDIGVVKETVTADSGRVKLKSGGFDPFYLARSSTGETIPEGTTVRVVDPRGGNVLEVEPIADDEVEESEEVPELDDDDAPSDK